MKPSPGSILSAVPEPHKLENAVHSLEQVVAQDGDAEHVPGNLLVDNGWKVVETELVVEVSAKGSNGKPKPAAWSLFPRAFSPEQGTSEEGVWPGSDRPLRYGGSHRLNLMVAPVEPCVEARFVAVYRRAH